MDVFHQNERGDTTDSERIGGGGIRVAVAGGVACGAGRWGAAERAGGSATDGAGGGSDAAPEAGDDGDRGAAGCGDGAGAGGAGAAGEACGCGAATGDRRLTDSNQLASTALAAAVGAPPDAAGRAVLVLAACGWASVRVGLVGAAQVFVRRVWPALRHAVSTAVFGAPGALLAVAAATATGAVSVTGHVLSVAAALPWADLRWTRALFAVVALAAHAAAAAVAVFVVRPRGAALIKVAHLHALFVRAAANLATSSALLVSASLLLVVSDVASAAPARALAFIAPPLLLHASLLFADNLADAVALVLLSPEAKASLVKDYKPSIYHSLDDHHEFLLDDNPEHEDDDHSFRQSLENALNEMLYDSDSFDNNLNNHFDECHDDYA
ncbi:hypothetical protein HK100_007603, partial [Physocladia obscura]